MLMEIGREDINNNINNKSFEQIKNEFFDDLKNYDEIFRSRNKRDGLQREIKNLEIQLVVVLANIGYNFIYRHG